MHRQISLMIAVAMMFTGSTAFAGGKGIKIGQLALHPYYGLTLTYDDNIYRTPANQLDHAVAGGGKVGSWIADNNLGLNMSLPMGNNKFSAGYGLTGQTYRAQSSGNNAINQTFNAAWAYKGAKTRFKAWNDYTNTQAPAFSAFHATIVGELVRRDRRWNNVFGLGGEYALGDKFFLGLSFQDTVDKYLNPTLGANLNKSETVYTFKTGYKVKPKTRVYMSL